MIPYLIYYILLICLLCADWYSKELRLKKSFLRTLPPLLFTLLVGLRSKDVGIDSMTYYYHFYYFGNWGCDFVEKGFDMVNYQLYHRGFTYTSFFMVWAILTIYPIYLSIRQFSNKKYLVLAFFFYGFTFGILANGMRQAVACGWFVYVTTQLYFNYSRKIVWKSTFILLIFHYVHATALFLIPLYFIFRKAVQKDWYIWGYILSYLFVFINVSTYIPSISIGTRFYGIDQNTDVTSHASFLGFSINSFLHILIFYGMIKGNLFQRYPIFANYTFLGFILKNVGFNLSAIGRVTMMFSWFTYFILAMLLVDKETVQRIPSHKSFCYIILFIYFVLISYEYYSPANKLIPYSISLNYF